MTAKEIRELTGLTRAEFCRRYHIPVRTVENWDAGKTHAPEWVLMLLERVVRIDMEYISISRQTTMDAINALHEKPNVWLDSAAGAVTVLPSVQSEITYCKDCRFFVDHRCRYWRALDDWRGANDYCSKAERKGAEV